MAVLLLSATPSWAEGDALAGMEPPARLDAALSKYVVQLDESQRAEALNAVTEVDHLRANNSADYQELLNMARSLSALNAFASEPAIRESYASCVRYYVNVIEQDHAAKLAQADELPTRKAVDARRQQLLAQQSSVPLAGRALCLTRIRVVLGIVAKVDGYSAPDDLDATAHDLSPAGIRDLGRLLRLDAHDWIYKGPWVGGAAMVSLLGKTEEQAHNLSELVLAQHQDAYLKEADQATGMLGHPAWFQFAVMGQVFPMPCARRFEATPRCYDGIGANYPAAANNTSSAAATPVPPVTPAGNAIGAVAVRSASSATGPSFDCTKAGTSIEKMICADPELAASDAQLAKNYKAALAAAGENAGAVKQNQRNFISKRNQCTTPQCVAQAYSARLDEIAAQGL
jgi:uncharacterized protein YecT (DUF1311 family)